MTRALAPTALEVYTAALESTARGAHHPLIARGSDGAAAVLAVRGWLGGLPGDGSLVARCAGPTLDLGCGPGRLTAAVAATGVPALGVDIAPGAVRLGRSRGVPTLCRSVFQPLPAEGRWHHVLLADGNIGIGGDPDRLLRRCRALLRPGGTALVELAPPGAASGPTELRLRHGTLESAPFPWAYLAAHDLPAVAARCALAIRETWTEARRWFAALTPADA